MPQSKKLLAWGMLCMQLQLLPTYWSGAAGQQPICIISKKLGPKLVYCAVCVSDRQCLAGCNRACRTSKTCRLVVFCRDRLAFSAKPYTHVATHIPTHHVRRFVGTKDTPTTQHCIRPALHCFRKHRTVHCDSLLLLQSHCNLSVLGPHLAAHCCHGLQTQARCAMPGTDPAGAHWPV